MEIFLGLCTYKDITVSEDHFPTYGRHSGINKQARQACDTFLFHFLFEKSTASYIRSLME